MPAVRITLAHLSISPATNFENSVGDSALRQGALFHLVVVPRHLLGLAGDAERFGEPLDEFAPLEADPIP